MATLTAEEFKKKYGDEAYNSLSLTTTTPQQSPSEEEPLMTRLSQPFVGASQALEGTGRYAGQSEIRRGFETVANITGIPINTLFQLLPQPARKGVETGGEYLGKGLEGVGNLATVSMTPEQKDEYYRQGAEFANSPAGKLTEEVAGTGQAAGKIAGDLLLYSLFSKGRTNVDARSKAIESNIDRQNRIYADQIKNTEIMKTTGPGGERVLSMDQQRALSQLPEAPVQAAQAVPPATLTPSPVSQALGAATRPLTGGLQRAGSYGGRIVKDIAPTAEDIISHQVTKALDLAPSDITNFAAKTKNSVGRWLADNNLIRENKALTQKAIDEFGDTAYDTVRNEIGRVNKTYKPSQVPRYVDSLKEIEKSIRNVKGMEEQWAQVSNLLLKEELTLMDVQIAKELFDKHFNIYTITGSVKESHAKVGLANMRRELKEFIEKEVEDATGADIGKLNNDVMSARALSRAITVRAPKAGLQKATIGDWTILMYGASAGSAGGLAVLGPPGALLGLLTGPAALLTKKIIESPMFRLRVAEYVDKLDDAAKARALQQLQQGKIPEEFDDLIEYVP